MRAPPIVRRHWPGRLAGLILLSVSGVSATSAYAQEITTNFTGAMRFEFDDNRSLSNDNKQELAKLTLSPRVTTLFRGPRYDARLYGGLRHGQSFDDQVEEDRTDYLGGASLSYQWPTSTIKLDTTYTERSLRDEQFLDTGATAVDAKQRRFSSSAVWTANVDEYTSIAVGGGYDRTTQSRDALRDFDFFHVTTGLTRELTERLKAELSVSAQRLSPDSSLIADTDSVRADFTASWEVSDYTAVTFEAGAIYTDDDIKAKTEFVGKAELTSQFERMDLSLSIARAVSPSSDGALRVTEAVAGAINYEISQRVSVGANVDAGRTRSINESALLVAFPRTRRLSVSPHVTWEPLDTVALELSYRRRELDRRNDGGSVGSNAIMLELRVQYPRDQAY